FGACQRQRTRADGGDTFGAGGLHADLVLETGHTDAAVGARGTGGRQHVVGAGAVITQRFGRVVTQEYRTGSFDLLQPVTWFAQRQDQVLGCIAVGNGERLLDRL